MKVSARIVVALLLLLVSGLAFSEPVDINTADAETLAAALVGVGPSKAQTIIEYRQQNGPFKTLEDLANVKGIGEKTVEKNRDNIVLGAAKTGATPAGK